MNIRPSTPFDRDNITSLYLAAFPAEERDAVAAVAVNLLTEKTTPATCAWVAEADDMIVGHIAFSPVSHVDVHQYQGYILAPLAVHPDFQKQRIGTSLIEAGIQHLSQLNVDILFVYGDPQYYSRFGFETVSDSKYVPPYQLQHPFGWQAHFLTDASNLPPAGKLTCVSSLRNPELW